MLNEKTTIYLRAHTELPGRFHHKPKDNHQNQPDSNDADPSDPTNDDPQAEDGPKWPEYALVLDTETDLTERQSMKSGFFRLCHLELSNNFECIEEGILFSEDLSEDEISILKGYCETHRSEVLPGYSDKLQLISRSQFIQKMKCVAFDPPDEFGALVTGFALGYDLTRTAIDVREAHSRKEEWSLVLSQKPDPETGELVDDPFMPRISLTPKDSKSAFIRFTSGGFAGVDQNSGKRKIGPAKRGRFLDLRTLGWALRNVSYSLKSAAKEFGGGIEKLADYEPTGKVSIEEADYCRADVRASVAVLNGMKAEFDLHPIPWLKPDRVFSPASLAKSYIKQMGISSPLNKKPPKNSDGLGISGHRTLGKAMASYWGGRCEVRIRNTAVPTTYLDFLSEYPTVNTLLGLWDVLTAETIEIVDCTSEAKKLISKVSPEMVFEAPFWKKLLFFAEVEPTEDILPVRAKYNGKSTNIGVNYLTSENPIYYAGPDVVSSKLLTGKSPRIKKAFAIVARGKQPGLKSVWLRGQVEINAASPKMDFFRSVIDLRQQVKRENPDLSYFLKILANSGSYGLFVEVNSEPAINGSEKVHVFSGQQEFDSNPSVIETQGAWYCPIIGSLVTASGRLLLALLERTVTDAGGNFLFCDTDSMAIVASENSSLVQCEGGSYRLPDGREAIKALSWEQVKKIVQKFEALNPYDRNIVKGSILKIEEGVQREIWGYAISAKRYALFTRTENDIQIVAAKMHGLGFLYPPDDRRPEKDTGLPPWIKEAWGWILRGALGLPRTDPKFFSMPAMMQLRITTHNVLKVLQARQKNQPYKDRVKALNFVLSPILDPFGYPADCDPDRFSLIAPFTKNRDAWWKLTYTNVHDGKRWKLRRPDEYELKAAYACPKTFGQYIAEYSMHPEAKSLAPDGAECKRRTAGLLKRRHVYAAPIFQVVGKETSRRLIHGEDTKLLTDSNLEYTPSGPQADLRLAERLKRFSLGFIIDAAGVSIKTAQAAKAAKPLESESREKLWAMVERLSDHRNSESLDAKAFAALEAECCVGSWME